MLFNLVVTLALLLSFVVQEFIPAVQIAEYATLFLPVVFFLAASVAVPFPSMLLLALLCGLIWDSRYLPGVPVQDMSAVVLSSVTSVDAARLGAQNLPFGMSVLLFGLMGALMQGVRPLFKRGRLELPVLMVGIATCAWLLIQYLMITFLRGSFYFSAAVWSKLITDTLLAMLASPVIFLLLHTMARMTHYEIKYEGLRYNLYGR